MAPTTATREPIILTLATDEGFAMPTAVAVRSALDATDPNRAVEVYVVGVGLAPATWDLIEASVRRPGSTFHAIEGDPARFAGFPDMPDITRTAYWRILLPELLPEVDRILYLDGDVMVRRDLSELFDLDLHGASTAGAQDYFWWHASTDGGIPGVHDLPADLPYVNTGVLLMSLEAWRARGIGARIQAFRQATPNARELDQDAINVAVHGDVRLVDPRWNVQTPAFRTDWPRVTRPDELPSPFSWTTVNQVRRDPWIVHFTTSRKPWREGCDNPMQAEWLAVLARTEWRDLRAGIQTEHAGRALRRASGQLAHRYVGSGWPGRAYRLARRAAGKLVHRHEGDPVSQNQS